MKKENQISPKVISLSFAVIVMLFVTAFYIFAWTEPTTAPPGGNVAVPINTGSDSQFKTGKLGASTTGIDASYGLTVGSNGIKATGVSYFESSADSQLTLKGTDSWAGLTFSDVAGTDYIWYNGANSTFAIGGGGSNVSGKKLHINGGTSIGSSYAASSVPANGLAIEGQIKIGGGTPGANKVLTSDATGLATWQTPTGGIGGSGTANYITVWTSGTALGNSPFIINTGSTLPAPWIDFVGYKLKGVREIDPVFNINNKKYTSYLPDSIGQKIEVVGESQLIGDSLELDLAKELEGSDLWLFWQTAYRESIIPFVSTQDNASLYAYIDGSKFIIKLAQGQENSKFSYRLIATRLDHAEDKGNLYDDQTVKSFIDIDSFRK